MSPELQQRIEQAISTATKTTARFAQTQTVAGGCINDSRLATLQDGRAVFIKTHPRAAEFPGLFSAEHKALTLLTVPDAIRLPRPIASGADFIVLEAFREGPRGPDWPTLLGQQLAQLHHATRHGQRFGFEHDNYLGTSVQPNGWLDSWPAFWRDRRLGWQLALFAQKTDPDDRLLRLGYRLLERIDDLLNEPAEPAVLLHGDLWSGNASADANAAGRPIIFDPASYYGRREAEFGMMRLFGGFGASTEAAYSEIWPLHSGADFERRIACYRLYHELNHLNLFGGAYYQRCLTTIKQLG